MPVSDGFTRVAGQCPGCGSASLFVGSGGHVTCAVLGCKDPCAADRLLHGEPVTERDASSVAV